MDKIRVKLNFNQQDIEHHWILINFKHLKTIADVVSLIKLRYSIIGNLKVYMSGALLPDVESSRIIRDEDMIDVHCSEINVNEESKSNHLPANTSIEPTGQSAKCPDEYSNLLPSHDYAAKKKHKKKRKQLDEDPPTCSQTEEIEVRLDGHQVHEIKDHGEDEQPNDELDADYGTKNTDDKIKRKRRHKRSTFSDPNKLRSRMKPLGLSYFIEAAKLVDSQSIGNTDSYESNCNKKIVIQSNKPNRAPLIKMKSQKGESSSKHIYFEDSEDEECVEEITDVKRSHDLHYTTNSAKSTGSMYLTTSTTSPNTQVDRDIDVNTQSLNIGVSAQPEEYLRSRKPVNKLSDDLNHNWESTFVPRSVKPLINNSNINNGLTNFDKENTDQTYAYKSDGDIETSENFVNPPDNLLTPVAPLVSSVSEKFTKQSIDRYANKSLQILGKYNQNHPREHDTNTGHNQIGCHEDQNSSPGILLNMTSSPSVEESVMKNGARVFRRRTKQLPTFNMTSVNRDNVSVNMEESTTQPNIHVPLDYCSLPDLSSPTVGSTIAYKVYEIQSDYTPAISEYKVGKVLHIDEKQNLQIKQISDDSPSQHIQETPGKFDVVLYNGENVELTNIEPRESRMTTLHRSHLIDAKLIL